MSDELIESSPDPVSPTRWAWQLAAAAIAITLATGLLFYYTARGILNKPADTVPTVPANPMANVVSLDHGLSVYAQHCAACHGPDGLGNGTAGAQLDPKPRDFSTGWFKLGSTRSGLPSEDDLCTTIRHGMLPAVMPPWPQLTDGEVRSVAMAVRHLAVEGQVKGRLARNPKLTREQALKDARERLDPGPKIALPPKPATLDLARGEKFYLANCAACHDPDGRGRLRDDLVDNDENPIAARDFTTGQFKGGNALDDIAMRIVRGLPGTPMPANPAIAPEDLWSTAAYVRKFFENRPTTAPTFSDAKVSRAN